MTTKKIDRSDELQSELLRTLATQGKKKKGPSSVLEALDEQDSSASKVNVGLSTAINNELNPEAMAAERRAKVQRLKELVAEGKYNPSSEAVAKSLGEEIISEIMLAGKDNLFSADE